jgi:hypothetical protein
MMTVDVALIPTFTAGVPRPLKSVVEITPTTGYDVSPNGSRLNTLGRVRVRLSRRWQVILVQRWVEDLKRRELSHLP